MPGTYREGRVLRTSTPFATRTRSNGSTSRIATNAMFPPGFQETTSYRTGRRANLSGKPFNKGPSEKDFDQRDLFEPFYGDVFNGFDTGHEFITWKKQCLLSHPYYNIAGRDGVRWKGPLSPNLSELVTWNDFPAPSLSNLLAEGTKAIAATRPTNPVVNFSTTAGEILREGIPSLVGVPTFLARVQGVTNHARNAGNEYLNLTFGWAPLIRELKALVAMVPNSFRILEQLRRDVGQNVRVEHSFPRVSTSKVEASVPSTRFIVNSGFSTEDNDRFFVAPNGHLSRLTAETREVRDTWFTGAYTYYFETDEDLYSRLQRYNEYANKLLGLKITPQVLWNLTPWSWLLDWYVNFGDIISNASYFQSNGLVLRWGYIMQSTTLQNVLTQSGQIFESGPSGPISKVYSTTSKVRRRATPFGFGLNPNTFSAGQWAILAALGLSKGNRQLNWFN